MKFPFGAGKFPICRFLGNVAWDRVLGETLACVIPVCPQPGVGHLHPIPHFEFSHVSLGWKIATSVWRGNCKTNGLFLWRGFLCSVRWCCRADPLGAVFLLQRLSFERHVQRGSGFERLPLQVTAVCFASSVCLASFADSLKTHTAQDNEGGGDTNHHTA